VGSLLALAWTLRYKGPWYGVHCYSPPSWDLCLLWHRHSGRRDHGMESTTTVHLCGNFACPLPWHRHSGTRDHGMESTTTVHLCGIFACSGIDTQVQGTTAWGPLLLSTCVGSFACPGIDTQVQGPQFFVSDRPSFCIHNFCMCPGRDRTCTLTLL
jgi:hypothetical protein